MSSVAACAPEPRRRKRSFLGPTHGVASAARRRCRRVHHLPVHVLIGGVACGGCWEHAIRADERSRIAFDLDPVPPVVDADLVDEVAVERAVRGESVSLTAAERREVKRRRATRTTAGTGVKQGRLIMDRPKNSIWSQPPSSLWPTGTSEWVA